MLVKWVTLTKIWLTYDQDIGPCKGGGVLYSHNPNFNVSQNLLQKRKVNQLSFDQDEIKYSCSRFWVYFSRDWSFQPWYWRIPEYVQHPGSSMFLTSISQTNQPLFCHVLASQIMVLQSSDHMDCIYLITKVHLKNDNNTSWSCYRFIMSVRHLFPRGYSSPIS